MKLKKIRSSWWEVTGYRLDCQPYLSGALETKVALDRLKVPTQKLHTLTSGPQGGIFNGPKFSRAYVDSPEFGVPFLGSSSMLRADISCATYLSKDQAHSKKLSHLELQPRMTLISCSGTIGNMVYARPGMEGRWASQHIMKVVAAPDKVPPGYLYAYLGSKFGVPLVVSGTYGSIIQSIEPEHLANLPVPRLSPEIEESACSKVDEAAALLAAYQRDVVAASEHFFTAVNLRDITPLQWHELGRDLGFSKQFPFAPSFRAINFSPRFNQLCSRIKASRWKSLGELCTPGLLQRGGRYKRIDATPEFGYRLLGQKELFNLRPEGRWIAKNSVGPDLLLEEGTIAVAARGTLGESELYCRAEFVCGPWTKFAFSEDILRVLADESQILRGCLYAFFRSETAFRMLRSISSGTKLQDNHYYFLPRLPIPVPSRKDQERIHEMVMDAYRKRHRAVALEDEAIKQVETAIEEAAQ